MAMVISPSVRFSVFRSVSELPTIATFFTIRKYIKAHDFVNSAVGLDRQLWVMTKSGTSRSSLLRGLIRNTEMVIASAELTRDFAALQPFLKRFVAHQPNVFLPRLWLAKSLVYTDPKAAFPHLEKAAHIVPADDRAYRLAVRAALAMGNPSLARKWCLRYSSAKFGGTRPLLYRNVFAGTGLRKIALEVPGGKGVPLRVPNEGVVIGGEAQIYDFDFIKRVTAASLRLHLGLMPGIKVTFEGMTIYGPSGMIKLGPDDLVVVPDKGFVFDNRTFITTSHDGDVISLSRHKDKFNNIDRVDLRLSFTRLRLTSLPGCIGT